MYKEKYMIFFKNDIPLADNMSLEGVIAFIKGYDSSFYNEGFELKIKKIILKEENDEKTTL